MRTALVCEKLKSLSLKDDPCQRSAHQLKRNPELKECSLTAPVWKQQCHEAQGPGDVGQACAINADLDLTSSLPQEPRGETMED